MCNSKMNNVQQEFSIGAFYLDSAGFAEFMKADNEDSGKALNSLGLAK